MAVIIPTSVYVQRRKILLNNVKDGLIFFPGNRESPMNYPDNTYQEKRLIRKTYIILLHSVMRCITRILISNQFTLQGPMEKAQ